MAASADVMRALFARVKALGTAQSLAVAYPEPNTVFTPPETGKYLEAKFFENTPRWQGLSAGRMDQGLLQIDVVWPRGQGLPAPGAVADAVVAYFPQGLELFSGSTKVKVSGAPSRAQPISEDRQLRIPVTVPWVAV